MARPLILFAFAVTASLASCGQPQPQKQAGSSQNGASIRVLTLESSTAVGPMAEENSENDEKAQAANGGYTFVTTDAATAQLRATGLGFKLPPGAPEWARQLGGPDGRFRGGSLRLGTPIDVASSVAFDIVEGSTQVSVDELSSLGNAALIPLHLADGGIGGLVRLPLYSNHAAQLDELSFVIFHVPTASLTTPQEALVSVYTSAVGTDGNAAKAQLAPTPANAVVAALAISANGQEYSPFNVQWMIVDPTQPGRLSLVPLGLPSFVTNAGHQVQEKREEQFVVLSAMPIISLQAAQQVESSLNRPTVGLDQFVKEPVLDGPVLIGNPSIPVQPVSPEGGR